MAPGRLSGPLSRPARCVRDNSLNIPLYCASLSCEEVMSQGAPELFSRAAADVPFIQIVVSDIEARVGVKNERAVSSESGSHRFPAKVTLYVKGSYLCLPFCVTVNSVRLLAFATCLRFIFIYLFVELAHLFIRLALVTTYYLHQFDLGSLIDEGAILA